MTARQSPAPLLAGVLALALGGCGEASTTTFETEDGSGEYAIDDVTGEASMTISTPEGGATMQSGATVEPDLPDGWSVYPGAVVEDVINVGGTDGRLVVLTMRIDAEMEAILDHYRGEAETTGHAIQTELTTKESRVIQGESEEGGAFSISVVPDPEGGPSLVQLTVGQDN